MGNSWFYYKTHLLADDRLIGPVDDHYFLKQFVDKSLGGELKVFSPEITDGQWAYAASVPSLAKLIIGIKENRVRANSKFFKSIKNQILHGWLGMAVKC